MAPDKRRGTPGKEPLNVATATTRQQAKGTPKVRQKPVATHVVATAISVIGGTGRHRWLLVIRCLLCGNQHVCHGRGELPPTIERQAACGRGPLVLHVAAEQVAA